MNCSLALLAMLCALGPVWRLLALATEHTDHFVPNRGMVQTAFSRFAGYAPAALGGRQLRCEVHRPPADPRPTACRRTNLCEYFWNGLAPHVRHGESGHRCSQCRGSLLLLTGAHCQRPSRCSHPVCCGGPHPHHEAPVLSMVSGGIGRIFRQGAIAASAGVASRRSILCYLLIFRYVK